MCGIFGYIGKKNNASSIVFEGLQQLEYRGYDSWGIAVLNEHGISTHKQVGRIVGKPSLGKAHVAIGHNRWATHGGVTQPNAHPHIDCTKNISLVHNGIIENFQTIKEDLLSKGHTFSSQTDTEVFAHLVEEHMDLGFVDAVKKAFSQIDGRNAFVVLYGPDETIVGIRNGSPLVFGLGDNAKYIASDIPAFLPHTKKVIFLSDKQGVVIKNDTYEVFDLKKDKIIAPAIEEITWDIEHAKKGEHPHFMLKEILEQPTTIHAAVQQDTAQIKKVAKAITNATGTYLVACGTASYAALYGTYAFSQIAREHINWAQGSEFPDYQHFIIPESLIISVSQSGETTDTVMAQEIAKKKGAKTVAIVNVMGSTLQREADYSLLTNAGPEIAVVSTKAFTSQLAVLSLLAYTADGRYEEGKKLLEMTSEAIAGMLTAELLDNLKSLAEKLKDYQHIYTIGKGQNYPIALETALKIKEASYIHGEGFPAGELKHGVIALIEKDTPCIALFGNDTDMQYIFGSSMELKARGAYMIGIGPVYNEVFDTFIQVPDIPKMSAIINTPIAQLLAYNLAVLRGNDPDKPRNLAKSVTVK